MHRRYKVWGVGMEKCSKCGRDLTDVVEEFSGSDHYEFNEEKQRFDVDIPHARMENPSKFSCFYCGKQLTKKQQEWFESLKG